MRFFGWTYKSRDHAQRVVFVFILIYLLFTGFNGGLITCLQNPELKFLSVDNTMWLAHIIGFPQFFSVYVPALILQLVLFLACVLSIIFKKSNLFPVLFWVCFTVFGLTFYSYAGSHNHDIIIVWLLVVPFMFRAPQSFKLLFEGARYYFLFSFVSASCWKIFRGHVFKDDHMVNVLKDQLAHKLSFNTSHALNQMSYYLIEHPALAKFLVLSIVIVQLAFVIGFFTKKYDNILFIVGLLFLLSNIVVMNIFSLAYALFLLTLIPLASNNK